MPSRRKSTIKIDSIESLQSLMQESYKDSCSLINDVSNVIEKLENEHKPQDLDDMTKVAKEKVNALKLKESAIKLKLEISKIQNDVIKHKGSVKSVLDEYSEMDGDPLTEFDLIRERLKNDKK